MNTCEQYISVLEQAYKIAEENVNVATAIEKIQRDKDELFERLQKDTFIKIPVVGDFSAGKSTLLNHCLIGRDLLPTDITPTTAVSYELWFGEQEMLEIWSKDELRETAQITEIGNLQVTPGDVVKVFLNNRKIKQLNDQGVVVVDMPGIGSGIEAHNAAIMNYIKEGSFFIVCVDIEQGSLRSSTLSFINELKNYSLSAAVIITKADKKPESEIEAIKTLIGLQAKKLLGDDMFIGLTSASDDQFSDFEELLSGMDADNIVTKKYGNLVNGFINTIISELQTQAKLLNANKRDFTAEIAQLKKKKEDALESLKKNNDNAQSLEDSAGDIMYDIENALRNRSSQFAMILLQSPEDLTEFKGEMLSVIRPVLINSYRREISEYQDIIDNSLRDFDFDINGVLPDDGLDDILQNEEIQGIAQQVLTGVLACFDVPPVVAEIIANKIIKYLPDVLQTVFGPSQAEQISEIRNKLYVDIFPQIINVLRPEVEKAITMQREEMMDKMKQQIIEEAQLFDDNLEAIMKEQIDDENTIRLITEAWKNAINQLLNLIEN